MNRMMLRRRTWREWLVGALALGSGAACAADTELRFGSVAMDIPAVMFQRLQPLTEYLGNAIGRPVALQLSPDMPGAIDRLAKGEVDIAYLTPVAYLRAREQGGARVLVKTLTEGRDVFRLMIAVREDSPVRRVEQLVGRRFAFGDEAALLQRAVVIGAGIDLEQLGSYEYLGHYDNIVRAVINGDFDAGILKDTMAYQWQARGIRILYQSPALPPYNVAVRADLPDALFERLQRAFLALDPARHEHLTVIQALDPKYDGFVAARDADYDAVRALIRTLD